MHTSMLACVKACTAPLVPMKRSVVCLLCVYVCFVRVPTTREAHRRYARLCVALRSLRNRSARMRLLYTTTSSTSST